MVYVAAVIIGMEAAALVPAAHPIVFVFIADVVATLVVFAFSHWYRNTSTYDPYWSVIPILIVFYWALNGQGEGFVVLRQVLLVGLVSFWGIRLTWNWAARWRGLGDEDFRYTDLRARHAGRFWLLKPGIRIFKP